VSISRQYGNCERALLPDMQITLVFYDIETSRKELGQRGSSTSWRKFDIPIRRDGGIDDLLAEATSPDRRFDVVICGSAASTATGHRRPRRVRHLAARMAEAHGAVSRSELIAI
jgi:hypothetical protein